MEHNKKQLYIVGAGGFGRELELWLQLVPVELQDYELVGFIDDNPDALNGYSSNFSILGSINEFKFKKDDFVIISIADPDIKADVVNRLNNKVKFYTFIAYNAIVGDIKSVGEGSVICPNCIITSNVKVGKYVTVNCGTQLGHDVVVGDFSSFMANVMIGGGVEIGDYVYFGSSSTIVPRKSVAERIKVSAGSVVIASLTKRGVYFGNPAKLLTLISD